MSATCAFQRARHSKSALVCTHLRHDRLRGRRHHPWGESAVRHDASETCGAKTTNTRKKSGKENEVVVRVARWSS